MNRFSNRVKFEELPAEVQEDVKNALCAFNECHVELYHDGHYEVMVSSCLANHYSYDIIGYYKKDDVFTPEQ